MRKIEEKHEQLEYMKKDFAMQNGVRYYNLLNKLFCKLNKKGYLEAQAGPYPATHGKAHILNVIKNLCDLLIPYENNLFTAAEKFELYAAAMIHDIGMFYTAKESKDYDQARKLHPKYSIIKDLIQPIFKELYIDSNIQQRTITIASAHAGDDEKIC